jgi:hypothetical protein
MRRLLATTALCVTATLVPALPALAAAGVPQRPAGPVSPVSPSGNGGDNGWGNCGHNSSGGNPHTGFNGNGNGNGGYRPGDSCVPPTSDPTDSGGTDTVMVS